MGAWKAERSVDQLAAEPPAVVLPPECNDVRPEDPAPVVSCAHSVFDKLDRLRVVGVQADEDTRGGIQLDAFVAQTIAAGPASAWLFERF